MKALRIVGGLFFLLFALGTVQTIITHLTHPGEPRHVARLLSSLGLLVMVAYITWTLFAGAFADPNRAASASDGAQIFGMAQMDTQPDRLTLRPAPKARLNNLTLFGASLLIFGAALPLNVRHHQWGWFAFSLAIVLFDLLMVTVTLLRWRDQCVWDRAADLFTRNGVLVRPLSEIAGVEIEKRQNVHHLVLAFSDGSRAPASPALTAFGKSADAERFQQTLRLFLGLVPPPIPVWPPPPTVPMTAQG